MAKTTSKKALDQNRVVSIPTYLLAGFFEEVTYHKDDTELEVIFKFRINPLDEWNTVVAIDASGSMRPLFGQTLTGDVPLEVQQQYHQQGLVFEEVIEGDRVRFYKPVAYEDAMAKGYLKWTENEIEPRARGILEFFSKRIDARGSCNLLFWGCGKDPGWVDAGEITSENSENAAIAPPESGSFGDESRLLPLLQYLVALSVDVQNTMVVILTDGRFSDVQAVKDYCTSLAILIKAGQRHFMKFVFIGMGKNIDLATMEELKDLKTGPASELFSTIEEEDLKTMSDLFKGVLPEDTIISPKAMIFDSKGNLVNEFSNGLPTRGSFRMPIESTAFTIQFLPDGGKIQQSLLLPFRKNLF